MKKQKTKLPLPIDPYLDQIVIDAKSYSTLLIKASPGSGKTTRLPWKMALDSDKKVLVLEPRRLAAKMAAERIADEEGLNLGTEVGYHFRFDKRFSSETKLIFYTEGTFLKRLIGDPTLKEVNTVILDEFHERHIETDVALAALRSLQIKRPELKIVLMSATLETGTLEAFHNSKLIEIIIPPYKIDLHYLPNQPSILNQSLEMKIKRSLEFLPVDGDVLVFVPGMAEMLRVQNALGDQFGDVHFLHGDLSKEEQDQTLRPGVNRKIILATNIAESSVTIPGVKAVIDSGLQREVNYSPWNGLKLIEDQPITQSSATQRAGRAGRTSDGICMRLYSEQDFRERAPHTIPEILRSDLTDTLLLTKELSTPMNWFTPPPPASWDKCQDLCIKLGALTTAGELTAIGRKMLTYPLDARLSRALIAGENLIPSQKKNLLQFISLEMENDRSGTLLRRMESYLKLPGTDASAWEKSFLAGFIDQVAKLRTKQHDFIHASGRTIKIHPSLKDLHHDYYLILDITKRQEAILILPIEEEWLFDIEPFPFNEEEELELKGKFVFSRKTKLGSIVIEESPLNLSWSEMNENLKARVLILGQTSFKKELEMWMTSEIYQRLSFWSKTHKLALEDSISQLKLDDYFNTFETLDLEQLSIYFKEAIEKELKLAGFERALPLMIDLGGRRELKIHYQEGEDPYVEAPIQDFYGQKTTPTILSGKVPLTLKLLGPHKRPIQVTKDLVGFWAKMYPELKKVWQRDYPRHYWPENPQEAKPLLLKKYLET